MYSAYDTRHKQCTIRVKGMAGVGVSQKWHKDLDMS